MTVYSELSDEELAKVSDEEIANELGKLSQIVVEDRDDNLKRLMVAKGEIPWDDSEYAKGEKAKVWTEEKHPGEKSEVINAEEESDWPSNPDE